jgi:nucleoside-diphosphate-sugar epimerase
MKTLITGANGFIGKHISGHIANPCDLFDFASVTAFLKKTKPECLLHLAWITTPSVYLTSEKNWDWVEASLHLAKAFLAAGGTRIVVAGSCAEYEPNTIYGKAKLALYNELRAFAPDLAWGRLFYLYGPHEKPERLVPSIIRGILEKKEVPLTAGGQVRDFLHVKDAAKGLEKLVATPLQGAFDIASGQGITIKELAEKIGEKMGGAHLLKFGQRAMNPFDPPKVIGAPHFKFGPLLNLDQGLDETIAWWKTC